MQKKIKVDGQVFGFKLGSYAKLLGLKWTWDQTSVLNQS